MKFDKRNPFAAWGHEQEVYTMTGDNETIEFDATKPEYDSLIDTTDSSLFVNGCEHPETAGKFTTTQQQVFFTNNENMLEPLTDSRKMVAGEDTDIVFNSNEELPMNGIHADDWKLYGEAESTDASGSQDGGSQNSGSQDGGSTPNPDEQTGTVISE